MSSDSKKPFLLVQGFGHGPPSTCFMSEFIIAAAAAKRIRYDTVGFVGDAGKNQAAKTA